MFLENQEMIVSNLKFDIDVELLTKQIGSLKTDVEKDVITSAENLANMTHAKVLELATEELTSLREMYKDHVKIDNSMARIWVITLEEPAMWIEEGRKCIVYGGNKSHIPLVLTPDGEIPITELKIGMMVLNQFGKWTDVIEIYDEHLVQKSKLKIEKIEACRYTPDNFKLNKRKYTVHWQTTCPICEEISHHQKISHKLVKKGMFCQKCLKKEEVYKIELSGSLNKQTSKNWSTMHLTGDHKVMTQDGWKEVRDLKKTDSIKVPSWSNCRTCNKPTLFGKEFCYDNAGGKCSSSYYVKETLKKGRHQSQKLGSRALYLERLRKLKKDNKTEEKFEDHIKKLGYTCEVWSVKSNNSDFIREYPVSVISDGKNDKKTFFIDFYNPSLNLGIEIDGKAFHCQRRDTIRDRLIKNSIGCDIIRVPAKEVWKKDFIDTTLNPILKNHSGQITMVDFNVFKISRKYLKDSSPISRRWDITVREGESFVCNKMLIHNSGFMEELLNGKSSRTGKNGKYAVIPFKHNKNPSGQSPKAYDLAQEIKYALKKEGVSWKKIETGPDGSPRIGLLHKFNVETARPVDAQKDIHKNPLTKGVAVYQNIYDENGVLVRDRAKGRDLMAKGKGTVKKDVMTFRVISEKHRNEGLWNHPGRQGNKIFDKAFEWAVNHWEKEILPAIFDKYKSK